jgi:hypothetical protein
MNVYVIGYDLNSPRGADDCANLTNAIKAFAAWWHHLDSTWIVRTNLTAIQVCDYLKPFLDSGDELLVIRVGPEWASLGVKTPGNDWLAEVVAPYVNAA